MRNSTKRYTIITIHLLLSLFIAFNTQAWATSDQKEMFVSKKVMPLSKEQKSLLQSSFGNLPMVFESNKGQIAPQFEYVTRGHHYRVYLTKSGVDFVLPAQDKDSNQPGRVMKLQFLKANKHPAIHGVGLLPGKSNYLIGSQPKNWHSDISHYAQVEYKDIYPGIDALFYGKNGELEFDLNLSAGIQAKSIRLAFSGADKVNLDSDGNLHLSSGGSDMVMRKPIIYQQIKGERRIVEGGFNILKASPETTEVGFQLARYDKSEPLVIDPVVAWSSFLGGAGALGSWTIDAAIAIAVDSNGDVYVTGQTPSLNFPTLSPLQAAISGGTDAFISKISADGSTLIYSTYMNGSLSSGGGGFLYSIGTGIKVDANGNAYLTGDTSAKNFPVTTGAAQTIFGGGSLGSFIAGSADAFVAKLNPQGNGLVYATYIGGSDNDISNQIALDAANRAYIVGSTRSNNLPAGGNTFQAQNASSKDAQQRFLNDVFVAVVDPTGSNFSFVTYLGGGADDYGFGIALDSRGRIAVAGQTLSSVQQSPLNTLPQPFPTTGNAFDTVGKIHFSNGQTSIANTDVFLTLINPDLSNVPNNNPSLVYSTYFGGSGVDTGGGEFKTAMGVAVDVNDNIYISGTTQAPTSTTIPRPFDFPVTAGAFQTIQKGGQDGFVAKFNPAINGSASLVYATLLGGSSNWDPALDLIVDDQGQAIIVGETMSSDFPTMNPLLFGTSSAGVTYDGSKYNNNDPRVNPCPDTNPRILFGTSDAYITQLNSTGTAILFSSYLGGSCYDEGIAITQDRPRGAIIIAGHTHRTDINSMIPRPPGQEGPPFPSTSGVFQPISGDIGAPDLIDADAFIAKITGIISPPVPPTFTASLNTAVFTTGQTLTLSVATTAGAPPVQADAYVALQLPDGTLVYMKPGGGFASTVTPLLSNWGVSTLSIAQFFNFTFTGREPLGSYTWFVGLANPGTMSFIGNINAVPFTVN